MAASSASTQETGEGLTQIIWGLVLAAWLALMFFGRPLGDLSTPFGVDLGTSARLAVDAIWVTNSVWSSVRPPTRSRDFWVLVVMMPLLPTMQSSALANVPHPAIVDTGVLVAFVAGAVISLSLIARRLLGDK
ncbi:MAG TPA: hypothetical protein VHL34_01770 [Rhizomicrobium sp.]|nr:hypothetical protein [Rhizomicrobium sp.]